MCIPCILFCNSENNKTISVQLEFITEKFANNIKEGYFHAKVIQVYVTCQSVTSAPSPRVKFYCGNYFNMTAFFDNLQPLSLEFAV